MYKMSDNCGFLEPAANNLEAYFIYTSVYYGVYDWLKHPLEAGFSALHDSDCVMSLCAGPCHQGENQAQIK